MIAPVDSYISSLAGRAGDGPFQSGKLGSNPSVPHSPADQKLRNAAAEFESLLLSSLWKSMKSTFVDPNDSSEDPAHSTLEDLGIESMSTAVGKAGGIGLGKLILKYLEPKIAPSQTGKDLNSSKVPGLPADILSEKAELPEPLKFP